MSRILVEARSDLNVKPTLDALAACCVELGHEVVRWRGPLSGRVNYSRRLADCDLAIVWNGIHAKYDRYIQQLRARNVPILFAELGWFPQKQTFQLDPHGVNAAASWTRDPLDSNTTEATLPATPGDLLVILQDDKDTNIKKFSPWFANMFEFVRFLHEYASMPLRVRAHPSHSPDPRLVKWMDRNRSDVTWDRSESLSKALDTSAAVACVNSSSAIEAMYREVPVLCYGESVFRKPTAVHCLDSDGDQTRQLIKKITVGQTEVFPEAIQTLLRRMEDQQWTIQQIPDRLPDLLAKHLSGESTLKRSWRLKLTRLVFGHDDRNQKAA